MIFATKKFIIRLIKGDYMGKKRLKNSILCILAAAIALILVQQASAAYRVSVYKEWHDHGDEFTVDGVNFRVKSGGTYEKVLISVDNNSFIVENGTEVQKRLCSE